MSINKKTIEIAIIILILVATGVVFENIFLKKAPAPINQPAASVAQTSEQSVENSSPESSNQQNLQTVTTDVSNIKPAVEPGTCKDFEAIKEYVLRNIVTPDGKWNLYDGQWSYPAGTPKLLWWKRKASEPFVGYPGVASWTFEYDTYDPYDPVSVDHRESYESYKSIMKKDADNIGKSIKDEAKKLGLVTDTLNTMPFQSIYDSRLLVPIESTIGAFSLKSENGFYLISLNSAENGGGSQGSGNVTLTCGKASSWYDKFYDVMNFKANPSAAKYPERDEMTILDVSPDHTVYRLTTDPSYYYFDGKKAEVISKPYSGLIQCSILESRKIGKGMPCTDGLGDGSDSKDKERLATY